MRNRLRLILLGVFCAGVLLTGIGVGTAIVEYTSLEYTGIYTLGGEITRADYEFKINLEEDEKLRIMNYKGIVELRYDKTVPENTVRCSAQYDFDMIKMTAKIIDGGDKYQWLYFDRRYIGSDFDLVMKNKDMILADLKQGKIGTYIVEEPIKEIIVTVNPQLRDVLELEGW